VAGIRGVGSSTVDPPAASINDRPGTKVHQRNETPMAIGGRLQRRFRGRSSGKAAGGLGALPFDLSVRIPRTSHGSRHELNEEQFRALDELAVTAQSPQESVSRVRRSPEATPADFEAARIRTCGPKKNEELYRSLRDPLLASGGIEAWGPPPPRRIWGDGAKPVFFSGDGSPIRHGLLEGSISQSARLFQVVDLYPTLIEAAVLAFPYIKTISWDW